MRNFLAELLKYEPSIVVVNPTTKAQLVLATDQLPTNKAEFKFFSQLRWTRVQQQRNNESLSDATS